MKSAMDAAISAIRGLGRMRKYAQDIVDRNGRHHQPKAIPEGGQYEEEGQYLSGQAKIDHAIRQMGQGKRADVLRDHVARMYAKMGVDSNTRATIQRMHEDIRGLSKQQLLRGMSAQFKKMKEAAENFDAVKDMGRAEFSEWLGQHPEYNTAHVRSLMEGRRYRKHYGITGSEGHRSYHDDGTGTQKHEAWEEAKWAVGAQSVAAAIQFQEYSDAYHGTPDQIMANAIASAHEHPEREVGGREETPSVGSAPRTESITREEREQRLRDSFGSTLNPFLPNGGATNEAVGSGTLSPEDHRNIDRSLGAFSSYVSNGLSARGITREDLIDAVARSSERPEYRQWADDVSEVVGAALLDGDIPRNWEGRINRLRKSLPADHPVLRAFEGRNGGAMTETPAAENVTRQANQEPELHGGVGGNASAAPVSTYRDRDGNEHQIEHNEGGLKAQIHPSEIGAVQAEMRKAIADSRNDVEGAEEYFHALSHFLGRGNDERSPHPGMRMDGLLKHQLAAKMQARLEEKYNAYQNAGAGNEYATEESARAYTDYYATIKAVETIADRCGITADMLPEGNEYAKVRGVLRDAASEREWAARNPPRATTASGGAERGGAASVSAPQMFGPAVELPERVYEGIRESERDTWRNWMSSAPHQTTEEINDFINRIEGGELNRDVPNAGTRNEIVSALRGEVARRNGGSNPSQGNAPVQNQGATGGQPNVASAAQNITRPTNSNANGNATLPDRALTEIRNATGFSPEEARAQSEENIRNSRYASHTDRINGGHIHDAIAARYRVQNRATELHQQAEQARQNGNEEEATWLENHAVTLDNMSRALSHFASRTTGGMSARNENGEFTHTGETMERRMAEYFGRAWDRAVERHGEEGARNARGVGGVRKAIMEMGDILGFAPRFDGRRVTFQWGDGNGEEHDPFGNASTEERGGTTQSGAVQTEPNNAPSQANATANAPTNGNANTTGEPTDEDWESAIRDLTAVRHGMGDNIRTVMAQIRNNGFVSDNNLRQIIHHLRPDHPVRRWAEAHPYQNALRRTEHEDGTTTYSLLPEDHMYYSVRYDMASRLRGNRYEWPAGRGRAIRADEVTPELVHAVAYNLPSGRRTLWGLGIFADTAMRVLEDPRRAVGQSDYSSTLERLERSTNKHARRFMQILNALHPDFQQQHQQLEAQRQNAERERQNAQAARTMESAASENRANPQTGAETPMNISDADYADAVNRLVGQMGEPNRESIERSMREFRQHGNLDGDALNHVAGVLGEQHPVVREARRIVTARIEADQIRTHEAKRFVPNVPHDLKTANDEVMLNEGGFRSLGEHGRRTLDSVSNMGGFNCYMNDLYGMLTSFGYDVGQPPSRDIEHTPRNTQAFFAVKQALVKGGAEPLVPNTRGEGVAKLEELARTKPNGTWLSLWRGGHNVSAVLYDGKWYRHDIFGGSYYQPISAESLARDVWPRDKVISFNKHDSGLAGAVAQRLIDHMPTDDELATYGGALVIDPTKFRITKDLVKAAKAR